MPQLFIPILMLLWLALPAWAADITVTHNKGEPAYFVNLLKEALEHTKDQGAYTVKSAETTLGTARMIDAITEDSGEVSIMTRGSNIDEEKKLLPIRIPLDRGLLGYRIFIIRQQDLAKFAAVNTVDDLKKLRPGQGSRWPDATILDKAGFKVVRGYYAPGLMRMLNEERFDMFPRATWEAPENLKLQGKDLPDLVIEPTLALFYPYPRIFMVSRKGSGPELAARIETGLRKMIADGSFDKLFNDNFGPFIESTKLRERKILRIDNALISPETPFDDKSLWFSLDPEADKALKPPLKKK